MVETRLLSIDAPASPNNTPIEVPASAQTHNLPIEIPASAQSQVIRARSENWEYINSHLSALREKEAILWKAIYIGCRINGYFHTFGNSNYLRLLIHDGRRRN